MGRATRWLRSLLGGKKESRNKDIQNENSSGELKEKKRWSFGKVGRDTGDGSVQSPVEKAWSRMYLGEKEVERNKHAIAVAAATTAAADAAVAAAKAAAAVVKLTTQDRGTMFAAGGERCAAVKIQTFFRAYLAKKALRALKSLVKLQALVRGYLVRKQAAATLRSMQALIKAQATVRAQRSRVLPVRDQTRFHHEIRPRRSLERNDESTTDHTGSFHSRRMSATFDQASGGFDDSPKTVEVDPGRPKSGNIRRLNLYLNSTPQDSTVDESHSSPLLPQPQFLSTNRLNSGWCFTGDECRFSTAQSTPRFLHSNGQPVTPAKSVCSGNRYNRRFTTNMSSDYSHHQNPNYMAKTESFLAKSRSQSAPKQRPEPRRRISLTEMVESRSSLSGVRMMKSCSGAQEAIDFKNTVVGRIDRSSELNRDGYYHYERDHYLQKRL